MMTKAAQPSARTFTQDARRAQIVQATIETLADIGYSKASFSAICRRASLSSTGMISYYFSGKPELFREVAQTILTESGTVVEASIASEVTYRGKIGAYIASQVTIVIHRPMYAQALAEIVAMAQARQIVGLDDIARNALSVERLVNLLEQGCEAGEFHTSDFRLTALAIRGAIDNVVRHHHLREGGVDLERCARELVDLFDRCIASV
ncbi:TetR/AcrR family transcriptional regulator [Streptomyces javensis]|uniref:TetR/AcrR family transcriptional regulator n=1 Tax=Streptomyces javensis TaxID=114698 RepID=UPI0033C77D3C